MVLIHAAKQHNSFLSELHENLRLALSLESLLITMADIFSFLSKREKYEDLVALIREQELIELVFYEMLFFVPGKTQCNTRNKAKRI